MPQNLQATARSPSPNSGSGFWRRSSRLSYNGTQKGYANGKMSKALPITSGTPQGVSLSPLYFAIFIASIADCVDQELEEEATEEGREKISRELARIWSLLFADDTKIASSLKSNEEMKTLKRLLARIYQWVDDHKMVINPDKMEHIRFGKLPMGEEEYNTPDGTKIKRVERVKDLGVTFQEDRSFKSHIADVKTKAINMSAWLLRTFQNRPWGSCPSSTRLIFSP